MKAMDEHIERIFMPPWKAITDSTIFQIELAKELNPEHPLYEAPAKAIALRTDCDDVLFQIGDTEHYAVVHLTWTGKQESSPKWPGTSYYIDWKEVFEQVIVPDNMEFEREG